MATTPPTHVATTANTVPSQVDPKFNPVPPVQFKQNARGTWFRSYPGDLSLDPTYLAEVINQDPKLAWTYLLLSVGKSNSTTKPYFVSSKCVTTPITSQVACEMIQEVLLGYDKIEGAPPLDLEDGNVTKFIAYYSTTFVEPGPKDFPKRTVNLPFL